MLIAHSGDQVAGRHLCLDTEQQALTANILDHRRETILERCKALTEDECNIANVFQETVGEHDIKHRIATGHS
ncbi:hypothetical protein D3C86_2133570 [compost metagenome]